MIFFKKRTPELLVGKAIPAMPPVELRQRILLAVENELKPLGFIRNRMDWFVRPRGETFEDELRISFDNSKRPLIGASPICGVSLPALEQKVAHLLDKHQRTQIGIAQNLGYVSPKKSLASYAAVPEFIQLFGYFAPPKSFVTYWFPSDHEPEPLAIQVARDFQTYGIPFCESICSYDDVLAFMGKTDVRNAFLQFEKAALHLMAGRHDKALQIATDTVHDLQQRAVTDKSNAAPALEKAKRALAWIEQQRGKIR